jgi:hypothetical protein
MPRADSIGNLELTVFRSHVKIPVIFLVPTVALLSLYCVFYFYLNSSWFLDDLPTWLHWGFGGDFGVQELVVEPSLTDVHLYGATIAKDDVDRPVIDAPEVHASLDPIHLLNRRLVFDRGVARRANVRLAFDDEGRLNLLEALGIEQKKTEGETGEGSPLRISFPNLRADDCRFEFHRPDFEFTILDVDIPRGSIDIRGDDLQMDVERLRLPLARFRFRAEMFDFDPAEFGDWTFDVRDIQVDDWRWRNNGFRTDRVAFFAEGVHVRADGRMGFGEGHSTEPTMTYQGRGEVTVPFWSSIGQYFIRDAAYFHIPSAQLAVEGNLEMIDGGVVAQADLLETSGLEWTDLHAAARLQNEVVVLEEGGADFHGGRVHLDWGYFDMFDISYGAGGRFEGVDPASALRDLNVALPSAAGELSGGFEVHGAVPRGLEFRGDPYPSLDHATRELAEVASTSPWTFEPASSNASLPADAIRIQEGMQLAVDYQRVVVSEARLASDVLEGRIRHFEFDYQSGSFDRPGDEPAVDASLRLNAPGRYARSMLGVDVGGDIQLDLRADGTLPAPSADATLRWERPSVEIGGRTLRGKQARMRALLREGQLQIRRIGLESPLGSMTASGRLALYERTIDAGGEPTWQAPRRRSLDVDYALEGVQLENLDRLLGGRLGLEGTLRASGQIGGTVANPELGFETTLREGRFDAGGALPSALELTSVDASGEWTPRAARLEQLDVDLAGAGRLRASGQYRFGDGTYNMRARLEKVVLERLQPIQALPAAYRPSGRLSIDVSGRGTTQRPTVGGDIQLEQLQVGARRVGDATFVVNTADRMLHVVGALLPIGSVSLEVPLEGSKGYHASLRAERLRWTELFPEIAEHPLIEGLRTTGEVGIDLDRDLSDYTVTTRLEDFYVDTPGGRIDNKGPLVASLDNHLGLHVRRAKIGHDGHYISVRGAAGLKQFVGALQIEGELDVGLAHLLVKRLRPDLLPSTLIEASGLVELDLKVSGSPDRPAAEGRLEFRRAEVTLRHVAEPLRIHGGEVAFSPRAIEINSNRSINGELLGGLFEISGRIGFNAQGLGETNLEIWSHNMVYRLPETANVTFDTDIQLRADELTRPETWQVSGQVQVLDALYYRDISLIEQQLTGRVLGAFQTKTEQFEAGILEQAPWLGEITFDVGIRARDGVQIQSEIDRFALDLEFRLDLALQQTLADPRLAGEVDVVDGIVGFQGERFEVRTGMIEYTGDPRNPRVRITAGADIRNQCSEQRQLEQFETSFQFAGQFDESRREVYHVLLDVEGPLETLNVQLESQPQADQRDILSLMLTGCTVDALSASGATQPTLEIALGPLLGQFEKRVRDVVQLTEFSIMPGVERTQVRIGDRLTRRIRWHFQLDTSLSDQTGGQRYQLEYKLSDRWSAEVSERSLQREENDYLIDLKLKYRVPLD